MDMIGNCLIINNLAEKTKLAHNLHYRLVNENY